ncbi:MAG: argininosuccinate lyase, partial [Gammaproteobacteria bacterium]
RDRDRLRDCRKRVNVLPLGAAALAGTTFPIDRHAVAAALGFAGVAENSLDAVSDRDFAIEFAGVASLAKVHLSRWCEELILWSSQQFGFVDLPDRFCTGSSIMPQKKNPDVPELVRGKSGRVIGDLMSLLTLMKGQPLAYNKDNQEDKEPLFDAIDTLHDCLTAMHGLVPHIIVRADAMRAAALCGYTTATDLADYLVRRQVPFRDAHEIVGRAVGFAVAAGRGLESLSLAELRQFGGDIIDADVFNVLTLEGSLQARNHFGATAPTQVRAAIERARTRARTSASSIPESPAQTA